jgi:hypothetical protein
MLLLRLSHRKVGEQKGTRLGAEEPAMIDRQKECNARYEGITDETLRPEAENRITALLPS